MSAAGTQILVPSARRRALLLRLALAGLPHRYVLTSADVLDQPQNLLTPESVIDDRRRAGIEGDLVAGLRRIEGVADASVIIAPGASDPLGDPARSSKPSAGVQLITKPGVRLSLPQIAGVRRFVAAGYPGLLADRVTVVDETGSIQTAVSTVDRNASKESRVQAAVQTALDSALGPGAAVVRASVRSTGVARSVQSTRVVPHGLLDVDSGREKGTERGRAFEKERSVRHYAYDTVVEKRTEPADALARMSVAVFLDERRIPSSMKAAITSLVRATAGADLASGDDVVVEFVAFAGRPPPVASSGARTTSWWPVVAFAFALCCLVVLGVGAAQVARRAALARRHQEAADVLAIRAHLDAELPRTAAYVLRALPAPTRERVLASYAPIRRSDIEAHLNPTVDG